MIATPRPVELLVDKLGPGWRHTITHGDGVVVRKPIDPDLRKQITVHQPVRSVALRLRHPDGRAAVAIWGAVEVPEQVRPAKVTPAHWTERRATKRLGARSVFVPEKVTPEKVTPAGWSWSFEQAFAWQVCRDEQCPRAGTDHPATMPRELGAIGDDSIGAYVAGEVAEVLALFGVDAETERAA